MAGSLCRVLAAALFSLALSVSATAQDTSEPSGNEPAKVCFRRPAGASGWAVPLAVRDDGVLLDRFGVGNKECYTVLPGTHEFGALYWARMDVSTTRPAATATVEIAPGDCRYFKVIMGFWGVVLRETGPSRFRDLEACPQ